MTKKDKPIPISRPNFVELCGAVVEQLEQTYFERWSNLGLSVDWTQTYRTIGPEATRASQRGFIRLFDRDPPGCPRPGRRRSTAAPRHAAPGRAS